MLKTTNIFIYAEFKSLYCYKKKWFSVSASSSSSLSVSMQRTSLKKTLLTPSTTIFSYERGYRWLIIKYSWRSNFITFGSAKNLAYAASIWSSLVRFFFIRSPISDCIKHSSSSDVSFLTYRSLFTKYQMFG